MKHSKDSSSGRTAPSSIPQPDQRSALLLVDLQNDFFPGGALGIPEAGGLIQTVNTYIRQFSRNGWPILATRDWHPPNHCSFQEQRGPFPAHCVQGSRGAQFHSELVLPPGMMVISKGTNPTKDSASAFEESSLEERLEDLRVNTVFILGVGTKDCILNTVLNACQKGLRVIVLKDAVPRAVLQGSDDHDVLAEFTRAGVTLAQVTDMGIPL